MLPEASTSHEQPPSGSPPAEGLAGIEAIEPSEITVQVLEPLPEERAVVVIEIAVTEAGLVHLEDWLDGIGAELAAWGGFISRDVFFLPSSPEKNTFPLQIILSFDADVYATSWQQSRERQAWIDKATQHGWFASNTAEILRGAVAVQKKTGASAARKQPAQTAVLPPPKYRLYAVVVLGVFLLLLLDTQVRLVQKLRKAGVAPVISVLLFVFMLVSVLVYALTPLLIGLGLKHWLSLPRPTGCACSPFWTGVLESLCNGFTLFEPPPTAHAAISEAMEVRRALELQVQRLDRNLAALRSQLHDTRKRTPKLQEKALDPADTADYMKDTSWMPRPVLAEEEELVELERSPLDDLKKTLGLGIQDVSFM
jgi:antibiotic biosynthesis monooxygenase (ABM) superfamily enzyme